MEPAGPGGERQGGASRAPKDNIAGLSDAEVAEIPKLKKDHVSMGPAQIRAQLKRFFGCDPKRNPNYLLAIVRTVREQRRPRRQAERRERIWRQKQDEASQAVRDQERRWAEQPELAADKAIELARVALESKGFGLATATRWLDQALAAMAARGPDAYRLATRRLVAQEQDQRLLAWMRERIDTTCPPPRPLKEDLLF